MSLGCEPMSTSTAVEPVPTRDEQPKGNDGEVIEQPTIAITTVRAKKGSAVPVYAALGALGVTIVGGLLSSLLKRAREKKQAAAKEADSVPAVVAPAATTAIGPQTLGFPVDLSPFGSPVGSTPVRLPPAHKLEKLRARSGMAESDADDQSDNASVRDQRQNLVDASQLQKTLKQMQEMADENRKLSKFLAEYKADAEKLAKLEDENRSLRDVTRQLEVEIQDLKVNTLPRTGAELEMFKNSVRVPAAVARSVCSNDDTIGLGVSTASMDGVIPEARVRRYNVFKQLLATLQGTSSVDASQPTTPRAGSGGGSGVTPRGSAGGSSRQRRQPGPEEAAVIGQAVYQLLDQFGGRMM